MRGMLARAVRAALLTRGVYNQAGEDPMAILHATGIVILAGISVGLGLTGAVLAGTENPPDLGQIETRIVWMWVVTVTVMIGWILWTALVYLLGSRWLGGGAGFRKVLRALGIVYGPGVLLMFIQVPVLGDILSGVGLLWILVAGVVAVHEVQKIDWLGTVLATVPGFFLSFLVLPGPVLEPLLAA